MIFCLRNFTLRLFARRYIDLHQRTWSITLAIGLDFRLGSCVTSTVNLDGANCTRDEGGPFEAGSRVRVSSHRELLSLGAMVVSVAETSGRDIPAGKPGSQIGRTPIS